MQDAYKDIGGRAKQEARAERGNENLLKFENHYDEASFNYPAHSFSQCFS
jgi:hypothetical protein